MPIETILDRDASAKQKFEKLTPHKNKKLLLSIESIEENFYVLGKMTNLVDSEIPIMELELCENGIPYAPNTKVRTYLLEDVKLAYLLPGIRPRRRR